MTISHSSRIGTLLLFIAIAALLVVIVMMFGARLGLWEPIVGFSYIRNYMNSIGYSVFGLGVVGLIHQMVTRNRAGTIKTLIASLIGLGLLSPMIYGVIQPAKRAPAIHDITTDTDNPPLFIVLNDTRSGAKNSLTYGGDKVAEIQKEAYPDVKPILSNLAALEAYNKALDLAKEKGWEIVAQDSEKLRFEAIARTAVYGFMDDVVIEVISMDNASVVNMRSVSRVGRSDRGVNAARIIDFTKEFNQ